MATGSRVSAPDDRLRELRHLANERRRNTLRYFALRADHMNFGSTLVHKASVDFISFWCGTSAL
jgi:hypothetical protein